VTKQLFYEDVEVGSEIPCVTKCPTTRQMVKWVGVATDYHEIHYDKDFAQSAGLPGVVVQGRLVLSFLCQLITDWIGEQGSLKKITGSYKGIMFPGEDLTCNGKVTKKYVGDGEHCVECDIWVENPRAEKTVVGTAIVTMPVRTALCYQHVSAPKHLKSD